MSARHMRMVRDSRVHPQSRKMVLMVLASYADEHGGSIFPSVSTVARNCELEARQTQRLIKSLVEDGFLLVVNKSAGGCRHATTKYALAEGRIVSMFDDPGLNGEVSTTSVAHDTGVSHDAPTPVAHDAEGCHGGRTGVSPMTPEESLKSHRKERGAHEPNGAPRRSVGSSQAPTARRGSAQPERGLDGGGARRSAAEAGTETFEEQRLRADAAVAAAKPRLAAFKAQVAARHATPGAKH